MLLEKKQIAFASQVVEYIGLSKVHVIQVVPDNAGLNHNLRADMWKQVMVRKNCSVQVTSVSELLNGSDKFVARDVVLFPCVLRDLDALQIRPVYKAALKSLILGGTIAIVDVVLSESGRNQKFDEEMNGTASFYPLSSYVDWLRRAGFEGIQKVAFEQCKELTLITAHRPV